ncbi:uroporphyrinogen-III C-methyltransferase [Agilicoccus flavus]|uniref:uroporphyrinogen-III C-methyltransferase n=1 Tax=Agilicoccus flavus TaxID=2775968 RepID=UPI001CF65D3B|nr:uroporphyrinogen-III C-methyltransferase [Agilicoccus flavus]
MPEPAPQLDVSGLRLAGRRVVVVGGAAAALGAVTRLLAARASVEVYAPRVVDSLLDLAERGLVTWHAREAGADDLERAWLLVAATDDAADDAAALASADAAEVLSALASTAARAEQVGAAPNAGVGSVTLVGGGPGDPGLLTVAGRAALMSADVVVTDRLAPLEVLADLRPDVEVIDVAKIPRGAFTSQERINEILLEQARAGRRVVRFKGGDPFVFGRGMEEVLACREAGVPVDVVPGVTSAVAGPALAGVPVTHRGVVQGFAVVSGHVPPGDPRGTVDWASLGASGVTLVVLMGVATLPAIAAALLDSGRDGDTPVAVVMDAGLPSHRSVRTSLSRAAAGDLPGASSPAVTVVGDVAGFLPEAETDAEADA